MNVNVTGKEVFSAPEAEIIYFSSPDIITLSDDIGSDYGEPDMN